MALLAPWTGVFPTENSYNQHTQKFSYPQDFFLSLVLKFKP